MEKESVKSPEESLLFKYIKVFLVVALYWTVSISMVFINKKLLGSSKMEADDAPLFITAFQCAVTVIACLIFSLVGSSMPGTLSFPTLGLLEREKAIRIFPLTFVFVTMMSMNNLCLKYVGVAFYFVGRSLTTVFNVIFTYLILGEKTSCAAITCCGVIIGGFLLGVDQESVMGSLSVIGVIFGVFASASVALNAIFTKKVLPTVNGSVWALSYYNNVMALVLFTPLIIFTGELPAVVNMIFQGTLHWWLLMTLSGLFGFAIGYVTGLQIKVTSPLTHNISGTAKACAQTVIATWWYNDYKQWLWWLSNWVVLGASLAYTRVKQLDMIKQHHEKELQGKKFSV